MHRQRKNRTHMKGFPFCLILGLFAAAFAIGFFCCVQFYGSEPVLFCLSVVWTAFYAFAIWSWLDKDRTERFEAILSPVVFGSVFLLLIALFAAGLWYFIPKTAAGEKVPENLLALILAEGSLIMFAFIIFRHHLRDPLKKLIGKIRKGKNKSGNRDL